MDIRKFICGCIVGIGILWGGYSFASVDSEVTIRSYTQGMEVEFFSNYALGTSGTYIYNEAGGTATTSGRVNIRDYRDVRGIGVNITNTDSGVVTLRVLGCIGTTSINYLIEQRAFTGTSTGTITVSSIYSDVQIGLIKDGTTTGEVTVAGIFEEDSND